MIHGVAFMCDLKAIKAAPKTPPSMEEFFRAFFGPEAGSYPGASVGYPQEGQYYRPPHLGISGDMILPMPQKLHPSFKSSFTVVAFENTGFWVTDGKLYTSVATHANGEGLICLLLGGDVKTDSIEWVPLHKAKGELPVLAMPEVVPKDRWICFPCHGGKGTTKTWILDARRQCGHCGQYKDCMRII